MSLSTPMYPGPPNYQGPPHHRPPHHGAPLHHGPYTPPRPDADEAASFAPTIIVNAACIGLVVIALLLFLLMARLLIATSGTTGGLLAVGHGVLGLAALAGAAGVRSGRLAVAIIGLLACPLAGVASFFALITGSIAGLAGGAVSLVTLVLVVIALGDVSKMGAARKALGLGATAEAAPMSGPISTDLPRVRPRRWPVVVVLLTIVAVVAGGVVFGIRFATQAERRTEATAFRSLETCLLGGMPAPGVAPSLLYRRMEIKLAVAPVSANPWPARCATHAHALHESKRRAGAEAKDAHDTAFYAERLGKLLGDARGASVYEAVDSLWAQAAKENYEAAISSEAGTATATPSWLDLDALKNVGAFSKSRLPLNSLRSDRIPAPTFHLLVDGTRQRGEGRLCTLGTSTFRCAALPSPLDETSLSLLGGAEGETAPLLFANSGQAGIFRPNGDSLGEMASYGGFARADGSAGAVGYDRKASKFVLLRTETGAAPKRIPFRLKGVVEDSQVALLDDNLFWATDQGALSVARLLPSGAPLGATTELGAIDGLGELQSFDGCRSRDAFFALVNGSLGSAIAIDTGDRWSPLVPVGDGTFDCSGKTAFVLHQQIRDGGTGSIALDSCTSSGCQKQQVDLDDVFQQNVELLPKLAPLALPLDGKLLLIWRAGTRGGIRMRLAAVDHIAATEDVILFDDRVQNGRVSERGNVLEMRAWSRQGRAVLFLGTTAGVWALGIDSEGKVSPIETAR